MMLMAKKNVPVFHFSRLLAGPGTMIYLSDLSRYRQREKESLRIPRAQRTHRGNLSCAFGNSSDRGDSLRPA
jgi:hypothetical protein